MSASGSGCRTAARELSGDYRAAERGCLTKIIQSVKLEVKNNGLK
jgi:hypothetical protein